MKKISEFLNKKENEPIDDEWLDNQNPVRTADGREAIVLDIDMSKVPNVIKGQVKEKDRLVDYEWEDNGRCIKATNMYGNPQKPTEDDMLVKNIVK